MVFDAVLAAVGFRRAVNPPVTAVAERLAIEASVDDFVHVDLEDKDLAIPVVRKSATGIIVMIPGNAPIIKASQVLSLKEAVMFVVNLYDNMYPRKVHFSRDSLREGLCTLQDCANSLHGSANTCAMVFKLKRQVSVLKQLRPAYQKAFCQVLGALLGGFEWAKVEDSDFEIDPALWALRLGPLPLAAGFIQGKVTEEILLTAEEKWVEEHMGDANYHKIKELMKGVSHELSAWVLEVVEE